MMIPLDDFVTAVNGTRRRAILEKMLQDFVLSVLWEIFVDVHVGMHGLDCALNDILVAPLVEMHYRQVSSMRPACEHAVHCPKMATKID